MQLLERECEIDGCKLFESEPLENSISAAVNRVSSAAWTERSELAELQAQIASYKHEALPYLIDALRNVGRVEAIDHLEVLIHPICSLNDAFSILLNKHEPSHLRSAMVRVLARSPLPADTAVQLIAPFTKDEQALVAEAAEEAIEAINERE